MQPDSNGRKKGSYSSDYNQTLELLRVIKIESTGIISNSTRQQVHSISAMTMWAKISLPWILIAFVSFLLGTKVFLLGGTHSNTSVIHMPDLRETQKGVVFETKGDLQESW